MLPYKISEIYTHKNTFSACSLLFPGHLSPKLADASLRSTLEESCTKISFPRHKIYKGGSSEVSPSPSLSIKKEVLKPKAFSRCRPVHKHFKIQVKQKTDCFNRIYEKGRGKSKPLIDWIRFNITYGIYVLWGRIRKHFDLARQIFQQSRSRPVQKTRVSKINQKIVKLLNFKGLQTLSPVSPLLNKRRNCNNKRNKQNSNFKTNDLKGRLFEDKLTALAAKDTIDQSTLQERVQQSVTSSSVDLQTIQRVVTEFASTICLIEKQLALQGALGSGDNSNKSQVNSSPCVQQIKKLQEILVSNRKRCSIIKQLFQKLSSLEHFEAANPSNDCTRQILEGEGCTTNKVEDFDQMNDQQIESAISKVWEERSRAPSRTLTRKNCILLSKKTSKGVFENNGENPKKVARIVDEARDKQRASIELRIDESGYVSRVTPKAISFSRLKSKSSIKFKQSIYSNKKVSIEGEKRNNSVISHASNQLVSKKKIINRKEGKKEGKTIVFSNDVNIRRNQSVSRKNILKSTGKKVKSRKDVSISEIEGVSVKSLRGIKSMKSILSMKSVRSITSNNTFNSRQMIKSMRTQRQIKFLKGKLKKVTCFRNYKDKLSKMNSDSDEEGNLQPTEEDFQTANERQISLKHLIAHPSEINHHLKKIEKQHHQNTGSQDPHLPSNNRHFILKRNRPGNDLHGTLPKNKKITIDITPHKQSDIESWRLNQQSIFLHLAKLYQDRAITQEQLSRYKTILARRLEGPEKTIQNGQEFQEERQLRSGTESPYRCLLGLNREIEGNIQLNQINKYYYNFSQFSKEEEEINKTKQTSKKDQQFFNMKVFTEPRKNTKHFRPPVSCPPLPKHLCQKDL